MSMQCQLPCKVCQQVLQTLIFRTGLKISEADFNARPCFLKRGSSEIQMQKMRAICENKPLWHLLEGKTTK